MPNFAAVYAAFRGSKTFLVGLAAFVALWLTFHFVEGFDKDFGMLNTMLSTEASLSLAFFTMVADQQTRIQSAQSTEIEDAVAKIEEIASSTLEIAAAEQDILMHQSRLLTQAMRDHDRVLDALDRLKSTTPRVENR